MAINLEQAKLNTLEDYEPTVIDEFRKDRWFWIAWHSIRQ